MNETDRIETLIKKLERLEKELSEQRAKKIEYHITIHELNISDPIVKELRYHLESLDIKELSGSLNLGNNFSPKVVRQKDNKDSLKVNEASVKDKGLHDNISVVINGKITPFSIV